MNSGNIILGYSQKDNNFTIYDNNKLLGVFGVTNIIKYITAQISHTFLSTTEYESFVPVIEKYFCKFDNATNTISIIGHLDSPLTGNIEIMMKIYQDLVKFNQNILPNELIKIEEPAIRNQIIKTIRNFEYSVLNHSLKIIVNISNAIKHNESKKELKMSLVKYSIFIINKINYIVSDNLNETKNDINIINVEFEQMKKFKLDVDNKIKKIENTIYNQNLQIKKISDYIEVDDMEDIIANYNISSPTNEENNNANQNENSSDENTPKNDDIGQFFYNESDNGWKSSSDSEKEKKDKNINIDYLTPKSNN